MQCGLAIEHSLFTAEDHRKFTEWAKSIGPAAGSRLVAKAWTDPAFKARLLKDGTEACKEVGAAATPKPATEAAILGKPRTCTPVRPKRTAALAPATAEPTKVCWVRDMRERTNGNG